MPYTPPIAPAVINDPATTASDNTTRNASLPPSPPVGTTRLADGRAQCPEVCLIGGTNAALWTMPAGEIIAELERDLGELPHHRGVVVTSAGVMPPSASPGKIKAVRDWVAGYPARV